MDVSNSTYKNSKVDLSYPAPGCGAGPWDGIPPGHKAQPVDLELAAPVLAKLGLPATWEGARGARRAARPDTRSLSAEGAGYACLFGRAYVGSPLGRGALHRAAQASAAVEELRYEVALAAALHSNELAA